MLLQRQFRRLRLIEDCKRRHGALRNCAPRRRARAKLFGLAAAKFCASNRGDDARVSRGDGVVIEVSVYCWGWAGLVLLIAGGCDVAFRYRANELFSVRHAKHNKRATHRCNARWTLASRCLLFCLFCFFPVGQGAVVSKRNQGNGSARPGQAGESVRRGKKALSVTEYVGRRATRDQRRCESGEKRKCARGAADEEPLFYDGWQQATESKGSMLGLWACACRHPGVVRNWG